MRKINIGLFRVLSLAAGLAVGLVLIAKISFENSYEKFYPNHEDIYGIRTEYIRSNEDPKTARQTPGAVAYYMGQEIPQIKWATRFTYHSIGSTLIFTQDKRQLNTTTSIIFADTNHFKVFPRPILAGNPVEVLNNSNGALVSRSFAEKLGGMGEAIGQLIYPNGSNYAYEVGGIFEDIPENSNYRFDIVLPLDCLGKASTHNWVGNDSYLSHVLLYPGTSPADLEEAIREVENRHLPLEELSQAGIEMHFTLEPLDALHNPGTSNLLLGTAAIALLLASVMNYIMIAISSLVGRAKSIAVRRCYGAGNRTIMGIAFQETLINLAVALVLATLFIFAFRNTVEGIMMTSLGALFSPQSLWILILTVAVVLLVAAYIPGRAFQSIPIAVAFRNYVDSKRLWKRILLFAQVTLASLLLTLLCFLAVQMHQWMNDDPGYDYRQLLACPMEGVSIKTQEAILQAVSAVPGVEAVGTAEEPLYSGGISGNSVYLPGKPEELFNCGDLYEANPNWAELMGIDIIEGRNFSTPQEILVDPDFAKRICEIAGWKDGAIGKQVRFTEHGGPYTIVGVFEDIRVGTVIAEEPRPHILFYSEDPCFYLIVRASEVSPQLIAALQETIEDIVPDRLTIQPYTTAMEEDFQDVRTLRESILIAGIVTLIIALIGLIGYTTDKTNRRRKEIALRKINGAQLRQITALFLHDIGALALVAVLIGSVASWFTFQLLLRSFAQKATVPIALFLVVAVVLLAILASVVILRCRAISRANPADSLRTE